MATYEVSITVENTYWGIVTADSPKGAKRLLWDLIVAGEIEPNTDVVNVNYVDEVK